MLHRSDLYFRSLLDNLPAAAYTCDVSGLITYFNRQAVAVWGREPALNDPIDRFCGSFRLFRVDGSPVKHEECWMALALENERAYHGEEIVVEREDGRRVAVLAYATPIHEESGELIGAVNVLVDIDQHKRVETELREKNEQLAHVHRASVTLSSELDLHKLVQVITDIGVEVTKAEFGAFFYNRVDDAGESYTLYTLSGASRDAFSDFPMPRNTEVFGPTFRGESVLRSSDITRDPRYGKNSPYHGMPEGHLPVRSYLAVPVVSSRGEVLGGLFFGHSEPDVFTDSAEYVISAIAGHAAAAIDNARLYEQAVRMAETLEDEVERRTAELRLLNQELESFNYSVSHDLRAPLRAISGYSQALSSDYGEMLDEDARYYLQRINTGSVRMSDLIDSMLHLSQLMRVELKQRDIDLEELVRSVERDLRDREPGREVRLVVERGVKIRADYTLLRTAFENLLGNAWKFTRDRRDALVEVGAIDRDGDVAYFVRDDGVGFDMTYADKLFKAFQRLHRVDEFEGMGIGLATVQRIVHRHGGRIWAESEPGGGACFYFTVRS